VSKPKRQGPDLFRLRRPAAWLFLREQISYSCRSVTIKVGGTCYNLRLDNRGFDKSGADAIYGNSPLSREPADAYSSAATRDIPIRPNLAAT
jgi:hypothetical protein